MSSQHCLSLSTVLFVVFLLFFLSILDLNLLQLIPLPDQQSCVKHNNTLVSSLVSFCFLFYRIILTYRFFCKTFKLLNRNCWIWKLQHQFYLNKKQNSYDFVWGAAGPCVILSPANFAASAASQSERRWAAVRVARFKVWKLFSASLFNILRGQRRLCCALCFSFVPLSWWPIYHGCTRCLNSGRTCADCI